jgi:hypothetical protein
MGDLSMSRARTQGSWSPGRFDSAASIKSRSDKETPPGEHLAARRGRARDSAFDGVVALAVLALGGSDGQAQLLSNGSRIRWLKLPEFQAAYRDARRAAVSQSVARLQQATGAAVSTLLKVMVDPSTPPATKVRAADSVLDHSAKSIELEDFEARLVALEQAAPQGNQRR